MRVLVPALVGLALLSASLPALAEGPQDQRGQEPAKRPSQIGAFNLTTQVLDGQFVDFSYADNAIQGFRVANVALFDATVAGSLPGSERTGTKTEGAQVHVRTSTYDLLVHDDPQAVTRILTKGKITLAFAPGVALTALGKEDTATFAAGDLTGRVRGEDLAIAGQTLTARGDLLFLVDQSHGAFDKNRGDIGKAAAKKHVGVEASFNKGDKDDVQEDIVSYGNVTMRTLKAQHGNLTLQVEGHGTEGRVLVLNVDGAILGADRADRLRVTLDNKTIATEENLSAFFDPEADGSVPVYHVVFDPASNAFQLLVRVPHYSVHTLSVTTILQDAPPAVVIGIVGGVVVLVASAAVLFRPRRE